MCTITKFDYKLPLHYLESLKRRVNPDYLESQTVLMLDRDGVMEARYKNSYRKISYARNRGNRLSYISATLLQRE